MGIPIISEIQELVSQVIGFLQSLIQTSPKPIRYILFLLFLLIFGSMIPLFLHMIGFHCDSGGRVMSTSVVNIWDNFMLAATDPLEQINSSKYVPYKLAGVSDCVVRIRYIDDGLYYTCNDGNFTGCKYALLSTLSITSGNAICTNNTNCSFFTIANPDGTRSDSNSYCFEDAYRKDFDKLNWFARTFQCNNDCIPDPNYYWESSDGTFTCNVPEICGLNNTRITYKIDDELKERGATDFYGDKTDELSFENAVRVKCTEKGKPSIYVFKINPFDYKMWLLLFVIGMMFFFLSHIRNH